MTLRTLVPKFEAHLRDRHALGKNLQHGPMLDRLAHVRNWIIGGIPIRHGSKRDVFDHGIGDVRLNDITVRTIEDFLDGVIRAGRTRKTATEIKGSLSLFLQFAKREGYLGINHARDTKIEAHSGKRKAKIVIPTKALVFAIIDSATEEDAIAIMFSALTGLRASEQWAVRYKHIDFVRRRVTVETRLDAKTRKEGRLKSPAAYREVPISKKLLKALTTWRSKASAQGDNDLLFRDSSGHYVSHGNFKQFHFDNYYNKALERLPVDARKPPRPRWHDLRHFAVSCWIHAGLNNKTVQTYVGHANIQTTMDTYGHLFPDQDDRGIMDSVADEIMGEEE
jgi:integrase